MSHQHTTILGFVVVLFGVVSLLGFVPVALAQGGDENPVSVGVEATVIGLDADTGVAKLRTRAGEVFELPEGWQWHVGHKVLCDRIGQSLSSRSQFRNCRIWETPAEHTSAAQDGQAAGR